MFFALKLVKQLLIYIQVSSITARQNVQGSCISQRKEGAIKTAKCMLQY